MACTTRHRTAACSFRCQAKRLLLTAAPLPLTSKRAQPVVAGAMRTAKQDLEVGGFSLKKGSKLFLSLHQLLQRDSRWQDQPAGGVLALSGALALQGLPGLAVEWRRGSLRRMLHRLDEDAGEVADLLVRS